MTSLLQNTLTITLFYFTLLISTFSHPSNGLFSETLSEAIISLPQQLPRETHLRFFFHDNPNGPTVIEIAEGSLDPRSFGDAYVFDNDLTEEQDPSSKLVGKALGMAVFTEPNDITLLMVVTWFFTEGEFKGSSINVHGRNRWVDDVRELAIVGGTGRFRYATGYVLLHNVALDIVSGNATVEYNVYVRHY